MSEPVRGRSVTNGEHELLLKWHMLRDRADRPKHDREALRLGLTADALLEIDLQQTADGQWVCLHDDLLEGETTGQGPVRQARRHEIEATRQLDNQREPLATAPLFLDEVAALVADSPTGRIQIDLKSTSSQIDASGIATFRSTLHGIENRFDIGSHCFAGVQRLSDATPEIVPGYDPCDRVLSERGFAVRDWLDAALERAPWASMFYLHQSLIVAAYLDGHDLVSDLRARGVAVDCWTIEPAQAHVMPLLRRLLVSGCRQITTNNPLAMEDAWQQIL